MSKKYGRSELKLIMALHSVVEGGREWLNYANRSSLECARGVKDMVLTAESALEECKKIDEGGA